MGGDTQLKKHVEDELRWLPSVDEASIGVSVKDGIVRIGQSNTTVVGARTSDPVAPSS